MALLSCPRCEQEPAPDAWPGLKCAGCGAELVVDAAGEARGRGRGELELDPGVQAARAARAAAGTMVPPRRRPPKLVAGTIVVLLIAALLAVGIVVIVKRDHARSPENLPGVSIYIRAVGEFDVLIDGRPAGRTPLVYTSVKSTKPILIEARQLGVVKQVVPDHDQDVFLSGP